MHARNFTMALNHCRLMAAVSSRTASYGSRNITQCGRIWDVHKPSFPVLSRLPAATIATKHRTRSVEIHRRYVTTSGLSYAQGPIDPPLLPHTIPEHFASIVAQYGDLPAVMARSPVIMDASPPPTTSIHRQAQPETTALTYASLDALSNTVAHSLRSLGVKKGDRVAVSLGNVSESVVLTYAIFKLGAIWVPLNPSFNSAQLGAALSHLGVEVLIIGAVTDLAYKPCRGRSSLELLSSLIPGLTGEKTKGKGDKIESPAVPTLKTVVLVDNSASHPQSGFPPLRDLGILTPYTTLLESFPRSVTPDAPLSADETINIQFTSGTTSVPKAAMLSHTSVLNNGYLIASRMGLEPSDLIVCPPPLFHCFGCVLGLMATATTGAAILFPSPTFDPAATLHMISEHRATGLYGVATMFIAELELLQSNPAFASQLRPDAFRNLRKGIAAGSSVPESLMRRLFETLGLRDLVICYGMTETSPVSCMTAPTDPFAKRTRSVGRAMPHTAVKVVAAGDRGRIVARGERGELAASGYLVMKGYYGDPERTALDRVVDEDGVVWMYSGDEACMDEDGYVEITGRIKDLIIRGGENIHPLEIENCLFQLRGVQDASVVGVPDERHGEAVAAFVVPHKGVKTVGGDGFVKAGKATTTATATPADDDDDVRSEEEKDGGEETLRKQDIQDWVKTELSGHLVPKHVFWIDEYPKTASGKIQKFKLRDLAKEMILSSSSSSSAAAAKSSP
ncbi:acetyl-CoA synthetase-like protein [Xylaria sp. FL1042]|nr:acetyl-CoA synthetase-like protein [Xylaria sp. FL1042]